MYRRPVIALVLVALCLGVSLASDAALDDAAIVAPGAPSIDDEIAASEPATPEEVIDNDTTNGAEPEANSAAGCNPEAINENVDDPFKFVECGEEAVVEIPEQTIVAEEVSYGDKKTGGQTVKIGKLVGRMLHPSVKLYKGLSTQPASLPITYDGHRQRWFASKTLAARYHTVDGEPATFHTDKPLFLFDLFSRENILAIVGLMNDLEFADVGAFGSQDDGEGGKGGGDLLQKGGSLESAEEFEEKFKIKQHISNWVLPTLAKNIYTQYFLRTVGAGAPRAESEGDFSFPPPADFVNDSYYPINEDFNDVQLLHRFSNYGVDFPAFFGLAAALKKAGLSDKVGGYYMTPLHLFHGELMLIDGGNAKQDEENAREMSELFKLPISGGDDSSSNADSSETDDSSVKANEEANLDDAEAEIAGILDKISNVADKGKLEKAVGDIKTAEAEIESGSEKNNLRGGVQPPVEPEAEEAVDAEQAAVVAHFDDVAAPPAANNGAGAASLGDSFEM